jgi:UDP-glucose 4-epimerase
MRGQKVIVTGGAGFIGSHLATRLVELGNDVHVLDDLSFGSAARVPEGASMHVGDVRDAEKLISLFQSASTVFHLAAISNVQLSLEQPVHIGSVNMLGTMTVLDAARRQGVGRVVYSSSSAVYGDQRGAVQEDMPPAPESPYGLSKYMGEQAATMFYQHYGLQSVSLRYFNVYGPGQNPAGPYAAAIARFLEARKMGRKLQIFGDGRQTRDFVMVDDIVSANIAAASAEGVGHAEAINVGTGRGVSILELATEIGGEIEFAPQRREIRDSCADISRAHCLLGFTAKTGLEEGLRRMKSAKVC